MEQLGGHIHEEEDGYVTEREQGGTRVLKYT